MSNEREFDQKLKSWSFKIKCIFDFTCVLCKKNSKEGARLESHHIYRYADFPNMRYLISNGVCLCEPCHKLVTGNEDKYVDMFKKINRETIRTKGIKENKDRRIKKQYNPLRAKNTHIYLKKRFRKNPYCMF